MFKISFNFKSSISKEDFYCELSKMLGVISNYPDEIYKTEEVKKNLKTIKKKQFNRHNCHLRVIK